MASTRKVLARVPADAGLEAASEIRSLGELATHLTELARWGIRVAKESFQVGSEKAPEMKTADDFLARFDENVAESRARFSRGRPGHGRELRVLKPNGELFFERSRRDVIRFVLFNHAIHHRGQLTVTSARTTCRCPRCTDHADETSNAPRTRPREYANSRRLRRRWARYTEVDRET
jgi:uncharacterized damage-inducible protein DinB